MGLDMMVQEVSPEGSWNFGVDEQSAPISGLGGLGGVGLCARPSILCRASGPAPRRPEGRCLASQVRRRCVHMRALV